MQVDGKVELAEDTYKTLLASVQTTIIKSNLDKMLPLGQQDQTEVMLVVASLKEQYPFLTKYHNSWPVTILMRQFLNNHRAHVRAKIAAAKAAAANAGSHTAGPSNTTPVLAGGSSNGGNDGNDDNNSESDVSVSDIDGN